MSTRSLTRNSSSRCPSKKDQIVALYEAGITDVREISELTDAKPSYIAGVLQTQRKLPQYFDLYTSTQKMMNCYSTLFAGKLHFKDEQSARESVALIDGHYRAFAEAKDRAGQHHALMMALVMMNRARWTGKHAEAEHFRRWILLRLLEEELPGDEWEEQALKAALPELPELRM